MSELSSNFIFGTMALDMLCGKVNKPGVVLTEQKPESRHTTRPTHFWCNRPYQETFGVGWTVGLTEGENRRRSPGSRGALEREGRRWRGQAAGFRGLPAWRDLGSDRSTRPCTSGS